MDYGKHEDTALRIAAFVVKVLFVACLSGIGKSVILLISGSFIGAFVWFIGSIYALCITFVALIILAQR